MNPFELQTHETDVILRLTGEVTIEHAQALQVALAGTVTAATRLEIDASAAGRLDAAALQVLVAAALAAGSFQLREAGSALLQSAARYGITLDPRSLPSLSTRHA